MQPETEPTPGAPASPAQPQPPASPAAPAPQQQTAAPQDGDMASLPEWAQKQIRDSRAEAAKARISAKETAANEARQEYATKLAKALGIETEEPPDPQALSEQLSVERDRTWAANVELLIYKMAGPAGADPDALLDSRKFVDTLDELTDLDPRSAEFRTALEAKVQEAAAKYPAKTGQAPATGPRPDPSQGGRGAAPTRPGSLSQAISAHYAAGR